MPKAPSPVVGTFPANPANPVEPPSSATSAGVPPPAVPAADVTPPARYEAGLQELERLVNELESGQLPLDRLLVSYQRGAFLLSHCRDRLQAVEDQIKVLDAGTLKTWSPE
jgi:exodeoxyribonuclease VII small subunit